MEKRTGMGDLDEVRDRDLNGTGILTGSVMGIGIKIRFWNMLVT